MFTVGKEKLDQLGAEITTREIRQQPELWEETLDHYQTVQKELDNFLAIVKEKANGQRTRVIFTGAGTSQYVGDTLVPYLRKNGDRQAFSFESIGTTDIVAEPEEYLIKEEPTLLVSFARSGNSPESLAAVEIANQVVDTIYHLSITCAVEGKLAQISQSDSNSFLFLMPARSNDSGFAMTGSFSCMTLGALLTFDQTVLVKKQQYLKVLSNLGNEIITRVNEIEKIVQLDFERIVYVGSGSLAGLTREAQLKILELTAGKIATIFDSSMGFRHGPKSFINQKTIMFGFVNNNPYTRDYDLDVLEEVRGDEIASGVFAITQPGQRNFTGDKFEFTTEAELLPDGYLALSYIMVAQIVALLSSIKVNNKPDTPSPTGTVNRVVKGVTIHKYK
ncbi:TPA: tagatose-6-phosphate ketose isomerase [Enterococcus hirae]|uniref:tagatose-6-phosphate ketose isomerase n=1 Tax=Enterococcus sp. C63 TaxID=3231324 RepID=UPI0019D85DAC|nr:SIS domain-containing protein [Enterococcus hirae]EMF0129103.1 SIS domain-containing protein [Enterococcus hirae]EMF0448870.1 SIS domain-containing protein [Enterococcus hirae]EMF0516937.1 SIS domain-containing protein [Enterococcus hirae]EMF0519943.1 SIS domain-containing protein [Enterococcus hirae]